MSECLRYHLKFKSFELLNKLYAVASEYYGEEIVFKEPLTVKYMSQIVEAVLPEEQENSIRIIIEHLFKTEEQLSFE